MRLFKYTLCIIVSAYSQSMIAMNALEAKQTRVAEFAARTVPSDEDVKGMWKYWVEESNEESAKNWWYAANKAQKMIQNLGVSQRKNYQELQEKYAKEALSNDPARRNGNAIFTLLGITPLEKMRYEQLIRYFRVYAYLVAANALNIDEEVEKLFDVWGKSSSNIVPQVKELMGDPGVYGYLDPMDLAVMMRKIICRAKNLTGNTPQEEQIIFKMRQYCLDEDWIRKEIVKALKEEIATLKKNATFGTKALQVYLIESIKNRITKEKDPQLKQIYAQAFFQVFLSLDGSTLPQIDSFSPDMQQAFKEIEKYR
jgi:hypothetical protein